MQQFYPKHFHWDKRLLTGILALSIAAWLPLEVVCQSGANIKKKINQREKIYGPPYTLCSSAHERSLLIDHLVPQQHSSWGSRG